MKMSNKIEPAHKVDLPRIKSLLGASELPHEDLTPAHLEHFFVMNVGNKLVGSIGLEALAPFGLLRSLAVAKPYRGRELGVELVRHLEDYARTCGIKALYLLTTTAALFFSELGYTVADRASTPAPLQATAEFKSICPDSAVCMMKRIEDE